MTISGNAPSILFLSRSLQDRSDLDRVSYGLVVVVEGVAERNRARRPRETGSQFPAGGFSAVARDDGLPPVERAASTGRR